MEPERAGGRHNRMLADTAAIHAFGAAQARHAAELEAITVTLASVSDGLLPDALGPVGASFVYALAEAIAQEARHVERLSDTIATAAATARASADAYVDTDHRAGGALAGLGA